MSFVDVTERTGIDFVHRSGSREKDWIAEVNGSGKSASADAERKSRVRKHLNPG